MRTPTRLLRPLVAAAITVTLGAPALAHGGTHPTPFPTTPTPGPAGGTRPTPAGGVPTSSGGRQSWEDWWDLHKWRHLRVKRRAAQQTGEGKAPAFLDTPAGQFLKECLRHHYYDIRSAACLAIGKAGDRESARLLLPMIADRHEEVRESAMLGLALLHHGLGESEVVGVLKSSREKPRLRGIAALALGLSEDPAASEPLRLAVRAANDDEAVRGAAALALGLLGDTSALELLRRLAATSSEAEGVRAFALAALARLYQRALERGLPVCPADAQPGSPAADPVGYLLRNLLRADGKRDVRRAAVIALGTLGRDTDLPEVLRAMSHDGDDVVQRFAMVTAAKMAKGGPTQAHVRRQLLERLEGPGRHDEKGFAALALGVLGDPEAGAALLRTFASGRHMNLRAAGAIALGLLPHPVAERPLLDVATARGDPILRGYSILAVGMLAGTEGPPVLRGLLTADSAPEIRSAAAIALGLTGLPQDVAALVKVLDEKNVFLRLSTVQALGVLRDDTALEPLRRKFPMEETPEVQALMVVAVGNIVARDEVWAFHQLATEINYLVPNAAVDLAIRLR